MEPIAFISRTLSFAEKNYGITVREVLAALWAMEKLRYFLHRHRFTLRTDHKAIEVIKKKVEFGSSKMIRWFSRFNKFDFDLEYVEDERLIAADALSRGFEMKKGKVQGEEELAKTIMQCHINLHHRKNIARHLEKKVVLISPSKIIVVLDTCETCIRKYRSRDDIQGGLRWSDPNFPGDFQKNSVV